MSPIIAALFFTVVASVTAYEGIFPSYILPPQITPCGPNGKWSSCASKCEPKCSTYKLNLLCTMQCEEGCKCNPNYVIDDESGLCVLPQYCNEIVVKKEQPTTDTDGSSNNLL